MRAGSRLKGDLPLNKLIIYSVVTLVYMALTVLIFFIPSGPAYNSRENYYFLIFSVEVFLVGLTARHFADYFFKGKWAKVLSDSCFVFGNGVSVFFFWILLPFDPQLKLAGCGIIPITVSIIIYKISKLYENRMLEGEIIKIISYLMAGFSAYFMFKTLWPESRLGNLTLYSFIVLCVFELASFVELSGNKKAYGATGWLRSNHAGKFFVAFVTLFVVLDLRRMVMFESVLGVWIFIFLFLVVIFIIFTIKLSAAANNSPEERLGKHLQRINFDKIRDISDITSHINDFVYNGSKSGLIACLFIIMNKAGVPIFAAKRIIAPVVDHKDLEMPSFMTRKDYMVIEERNKQRRMKVVETVIKNLEVYGRGSYNGFGTGSSIVQKYN